MVRFKIRGKFWKFERPEKLKNDDWGHCDSPTTFNKTIKVKKSLKGESELSTVIHEAIHAGLWDIDEDAVDELADDLARML